MWVPTRCPWGRAAHGAVLPITLGARGCTDSCHLAASCHPPQIPSRHPIWERAAAWGRALCQWAEGAQLCFWGGFGGRCWERRSLCSMLQGSHAGDVGSLHGLRPAFPGPTRCGYLLCEGSHCIPLVAGVPAEVVEHSLTLWLVLVSHCCPTSHRQRGWEKWEHETGGCWGCSLNAAVVLCMSSTGVEMGWGLWGQPSSAGVHGGDQALLPPCVPAL